MLRGLWQLTWLEIKIFVREPLGLFGTVVVPVLLFVVLGRLIGRDLRPTAAGASRAVAVDLPVLVSMFIAVSAVLSLVTIIAIYREGGILKRLRATPLHPYTILSAHVVVKLSLTAVTLILMMAAGARYYPMTREAPLVSFGLALLLSTWSISSIGFLIAAIVPTARFAQPLGAFILYPLLGFSGLFVPVAMLPAPMRAVASVNPLAYGVSLLQGIWKGEGWWAHAGDVGALVLAFVCFAAVSARVFRWE